MNNIEIVRARARRQAGLSLIGWLLVLVIAGALVLAAFRVVPAYIESARLGSALNSVKKDAKTESVGTLRRKISSQLTMDSVEGVSVDAFKFVRDGDRLTISIEVPIKRRYIGNLGFVVQSKHSITVTRKDGY
jgi:hypothetical protein